MRPALRLLSLAAALALGACAPAVRPAPSPADGGDGPRIVALLQTSAGEWNRGDLDGFLLPYADSPDVTFVGRTGMVRGKQAIRDRYVASYFHPGGQLPGNLAFREVEVRMLGRDHALAVGRWVISDRTTGAETSAGLFSLTWQRRPEGWRIIHDHSS